MQKGWSEVVASVVDLMSLQEDVDRDFAVARRRAWLRLLLRWIWKGKTGTGRLLSFGEERHAVAAAGGVARGRTTVEVSRIVGSDGKSDCFDDRFMPLSGGLRERWMRVDRAFRLGEDLPPVTLLKLGEAYFVEDGHHRVSVARFHGAEWIDVEVTEFWTPGASSPASPARESRADGPPQPSGRKSRASNPLALAPVRRADAAKPGYGGTYRAQSPGEVGTAGFVHGRGARR